MSELKLSYEGTQYVSFTPVELNKAKLGDEHVVGAHRIGTNGFVHEVCKYEVNMLVLAICVFFNLYCVFSCNTIYL